MKTQNNYLNFLNDLKLFIEFNSKIDICKLARKHDLKYYSYAREILLSYGIIKREIKQGFFHWNTIEPTLEMARELEKKMNEYGYKSIAENKFTKKEDSQKNHGGKRDGAGRKTKEIENKYLDSITFKLFWFKITVNLNYKTIK